MKHFRHGFVPGPMNPLNLLPVEQVASRYELQDRIARRNGAILALTIYAAGMTLAFVAACLMH